MEQDKKYLVFDAYVFGTRNFLAYIRPLLLTGLIIIGVGGFTLFALLFVLKNLFSTHLLIAAEAYKGMGELGFLSLFRENIGSIVLLFFILYILASLFWGWVAAIFYNYGLLFFDEKTNQKIVFPSFVNVVKIAIV